MSKVSSKEEALKLALTIKPRIDTCEEWKYGYIFGCKDDPQKDGGYGPSVILKESGEAIRWSDYLAMTCSVDSKYSDDRLLGVYDITDDGAFIPVRTPEEELQTAEVNMITFDKAVKLAEEFGANNGVVTEYNNCFVFNAKEDDLSASPLVIVKETGDRLYYPAWIGSKGELESKYLKSYRFTNDKWDEFIEEL